MPFGKHVHGFSHLSASRDRLVVRHLDVEGNVVHTFVKLADGTVKLEL
jgi:hypothetical protein